MNVLVTKQFIKMLYEGCERKHTYRINFIRLPSQRYGLASSWQSIAADTKQQAIAFAKRIMEVENPNEDLSNMVLKSAVKLPKGHKSRY